jgi:hypothetical protein
MSATIESRSLVPANAAADMGYPYAYGVLRTVIDEHLRGAVDATSVRLTIAELDALLHSASTEAGAR